MLSALGVYPVMAGADFYGLASPMFERAAVHLAEPYYAGGDLVLNAPGSSAANTFIRSINVNGTTWNKAWISLDVIRSGAEILFTLGAEADTSWASAPEDAPPSVCSRPGVSGSS